jgi:hypothetical protein
MNPDGSRGPPFGRGDSTGVASEVVHSGVSGTVGLTVGLDVAGADAA